MNLHLIFSVIFLAATITPALCITFNNLLFKAGKFFLPDEAKDLMSTYSFMTRNKDSVDDIKNDLCEINEARRAFANQQNLASMAEMYWDESLAEKAKSDKCEKAHDGYRVFRFSNDVCSLSWNAEVAGSITENGLASADPKAPLGIIELLLPGFNKIGCAPVQCEQNHDCLVASKFDFQYTCLLGSDSDPLQSLGSGKPGSKCAANKRDNDGLCSAVDVESLKCGGQLATASLAIASFLIVAVLC